MGLLGEVFCNAGLHVDSASFAQYASELQAVEGQISDFSSGYKAIMAGAFTMPAVAIAGIASYGVTVASSMQNASTSLTTVYGDLDVAKEKFMWLQDFAASTPFEFPELLDATVKLKAYGIEAQDYMGVLGDTASAMGKTLGDSVEMLADAQTGEFERLKEFGVKAVAIAKNNFESMGVSAEQIGQTALMYTDKYGKEQIKVIDRNNREAITTALVGVDGIFQKYTGAMEKASKTMSGMWSTIKDNVSMGLADMVGYKDMEVQSLSLMSVLMGLEKVVVGITGKFLSMSEPVQTFAVVATFGAAAAGLLAAGILGYGMILPMVTAETSAFAVAINAAIWPATLTIGILALVAAGLVYLNEKTGIVSATFAVLGDVFTITANYLSTSVTTLKNWIVTEIDAIKAKFLEIIPEGVINKVADFYTTVTTYFGGAAQEISNKADLIKVKNGEMTVSFGGAGESASLFGGMASYGYGVAGTAATTAGGDAAAAVPSINSLSTALGDSGNAASVAAPQILTLPPAVDSANSAMTAGVSANHAYAASFTDISNMASEAASAAVSASSRIGAALKTSLSQAGQVEALAGKWNTTAKLGTTSKGGSGTGESNVKIISTVNKNTVNNNGDKLSASKAKAAGV